MNANIHSRPSYSIRTGARVTDEEFKVIRVELERLGSAINQAVRQLVEQKATIDAFQRILEQKRLASPEEMERARIQAARQLKGE